MSERERNVVSGANEDPEASGSPTQSRREFLGAAVIAAVGLGVGCGDGSVAGEDGGAARGDAARLDARTPGPEDAAASDAGAAPIDPPETVPESTDAFPLGVASGDATSTSAIFWARYAGAMPLELVVWEMDGETYARTAHVGSVEPSEGGYVHADVATLAPGARHRFAFFELDGDARVARSAIGRMRAALAEGALETLLIGAVSCTANTRSLATLAHAGARDDLDVFLYVGDTTYNDGSSSLDEYRAKWIQSVGRAEYRALRGATSALATWDDHEFDNDWNPETFDAASRTAAVRTFFEHQPVRRDAAAPDRVWKSVRWGRTAELFVLDCRSERRPSTRGTPEAEYVSRAQMDWLKSALEASDAVFKIIVNSVPISDFPGAFDFAQNDRWEGYPAQRQEILSFIDERALTGVLWVAGDFHLASAQRVATSGPGSAQTEVLVGPGAQTGNLLARFLTSAQFDFATGENNYTVLELDPATTRARVWWHDGDGVVIETQEYDLG
ncbi:MAG: alkaline phosphatase D family protein [Myxococcota bacterium]|nr:alkaline phosphatase D family protein [Myxococcota bacterium]